MSASAKRRLRDFRAPDEVGAEQRGWTVVRSAYREREPVMARRRRPHLRLAIAPLTAVLIGAVVLSPAGATVKRLIRRALDVHPAAPALTSLPSTGRILLSGPSGTWTAAADGSIRHLGTWQQAGWSPHGLYVVVSSGARLAAVDPRGNIHWAIARPRISDASWFSPTGYRIAYLSAGSLRVIAGDGTGDHPLAPGVADVAPVWRPDHPYQLAYVTGRGSVVVRDADTGLRLWSTRPGPMPRELAWSSDGRRLVVLFAHAARTYTAGGRPRSWFGWRPDESASAAALSPDGSTLALLLDSDQLVVARITSPKPVVRQLLAGSGLRGLSWSPDGRWLLVSWPALDQWVFVRAAGTPRVEAVSRIEQQFSNPGFARGFPQLDGWCCTAGGTAG
jgi:hypothetical protein